MSRCIQLFWRRFQAKYPPSNRPATVVQFLLRLLTRVPLRLLYPWSALLYFVAYHVMRWRRDDCERDVTNAFPDKSASERAAIIRRAYRNLADTLVEAF